MPSVVGASAPTRYHQATVSRYVEALVAVLAVVMVAALTAALLGLTMVVRRSAGVTVAFALYSVCAQVR